MRTPTLVLAVSAAALLAGCAGHGPFNRARPDEFAVARNAPLIVPPDFALTPPRPGEPDQSGTDPRAQALQALFDREFKRGLDEHPEARPSSASTATTTG